MFSNGIKLEKGFKYHEFLVVAVETNSNCFRILELSFYVSHGPQF